MTVEAPADKETTVAAPRPGWDKALRVAGLTISILAALLSAFFEVLLTTLRWGDLTSIWRDDPIGSGKGPLLGLSIVLAVVGNVAIAWFAVTTTGRRWALGPPWALWTLFMLIAAGFHTSEGDYLLGGNNIIALVTILLGSVAFAVYSYRLILQPVRRP